MRKVGCYIFVLFVMATFLPIVTALNTTQFTGSEANNCIDLPCVNAGELIYTLDSKPIDFWKTTENNYLFVGENGFVNLYSLNSNGFEIVWELEVDNNGNISSASYNEEYDLLALGNETGTQIVDVGENREKLKFIPSSIPIVDLAWDPIDGADTNNDQIIDLPHIWIALQESKRAVQYDLGVELPTTLQTNEHTTEIGAINILTDGSIITGGENEIFVHSINNVNQVIKNEDITPAITGTLDIIITNNDESKIFFSEYKNKKIISYDTNSWTQSTTSGQGNNPINLGFEQIESSLISSDDTILLGTGDKLFFIDSETMIMDENELDYPLGIDAIANTIYGGILVVTNKNIHLLDFDSDGDGTTDTKDDFPFDDTQTTDSDGDGCGDNLNGNNPDSFPEDEFECVDSDGDGVGDNGDDFPDDDSETTDSDGDNIGDNADKFPNDDSQWSDEDEDGYGDNPDGQQADDCPELFGTSTLDKRGCIDSDGDGWSNPIEGQDDTKADLFPDDSTQWRDSDGDGFGDNPNGNNGDDCPLEFGTSNKTLEYNEETNLWLTPNYFGCKDSDLDGFADSTDQFNDNKNEWLDGDNDGVGKNADYNDNENSYSTLEGKCALQEKDNLTEDCETPEDNIKSEEELKQEQLQASIKNAATYGAISFVVIIAAILIVSQIFKSLNSNKRIKIEKDSIGNEEVLATESGEGFEYDSTFSGESAWEDDPIDELNVNSESIDAAFDKEVITKTDPLNDNKNIDEIEKPKAEVVKEPPNEIPPIPESGLPDGWTMEQWKWYGAEWLEKNK